jgi:hypothetical protein
MKEDEPGITFISLLRMFRRTQKIRPVVEMSTCGHCKTSYNIHSGHMCPHIRALYIKLGDLMSYQSKTFKRTGNGRMAASIKSLATSCHLKVNHFNASGWVLKDITITVYGHVDDLSNFERQLPDGVQS